MHHRRTHPAFSLIELLAVIAIVGVLVAIAIPALAGARRTARFTVAQSDARQMMQMLGVYTQDNRDTHPYILAGQFDALAHIEPVGPNDGISPGAHMRRWHMAMMEDQPAILDMVYPQISFWPDLRTRGDETGDYQASVIATAALFAAPGYFSDTQPIHDHQLRATRTTEIRYPSAKMILDHWGSIWINPQRMLDADDTSRLRGVYTFGDGSAEILALNELDGPYVERNFLGMLGPGLSTTDGLAGRDR